MMVKTSVFKLLYVKEMRRLHSYYAKTSITVCHYYTQQ
jgi:hypothetical protein